MLQTLCERIFSVTKDIIKSLQGEPHTNMKKVLLPGKFSYTKYHMNFL